MTAVLIIVGLILSIIAFVIGILMIADWFVAQREDEWNELDEWRRKVEAMRRIQRQEGDA